MQVGSKKVWSRIALCVTKHSNRDRVFRFLLERAQNEPDLRSNYYQALEVFNDSRAIPLLTRQYKAYKKSGVLAKSELRLSELMQVFDYLNCSRALLALDGSQEFEAAIQEMLTHPNEKVRASAQLLLTKKES